MRKNDPDPSTPDGLLRPGPRKRDLALRPPERVSLHKQRAGWFQARTAWPVREPSAALLVRARRTARQRLDPAPMPVQWESIGPTNIGGRMTSLVCHPTQPDRIWAGSAGGGVWQSSDAGRTWQTFWNSQDILNIGSLAIDPANPDLLYCGTGEANLSADSYPGVGLYQSTNAGRSWRLFAASARTKIPKRIGVIAIDPFNPRHLCLGGVGYAEVDVEGGFGGMYTSVDGGASWRRETFISANNYWCHAITFHPTRRDTLFATFTEEGTRNGIWRSTDGGQQWQHLSNGLPPPELMSRTSLCIAPSSPDVIYALVAGTDEGVLGIFRSANRGTSWQAIHGTHFRDEGQMTYGNTIAVHPTNPNHVLCGGVDLHLSTNGGQRWRKVTDWAADRGQPNYAHADHHRLVMPAAAAGRVYDMNDGGMDVSEDGGRTWTNRSNGLAATMFYDMDVAQSNGKVFAGGAQDNGTLATDTGAANQFFELSGGDGGWVVFDPQNEAHVYTSFQNMGLIRFRPNQQPQRVAFPPQLTKAERESVWMSFVALEPSNANTVYVGSFRVWRSRDDGNTWQPVSQRLDGSPITAIEVAVRNPQRLYVGTENGGIFRSDDGGTNWTANISSATLPGYTITRLTTRSDNADVVYATVANFGRSHLFRSRDAGRTWEDVDRGQLPDVPHHAVVCWPGDPNSVYVANDAGVYFSPDQGQTWTNMTGNLPNVMVVDLVCHAGDGTLHAATYGRGLWRLRVR